MTDTENLVLRLSPQLAQRIGLNESIVLMQLDYLIAHSNNYRDGRNWTYQSACDLRERYFPWWCEATVYRVLRRLESLGLIVTANYNHHAYDRTRWFALTHEAMILLGHTAPDDAASEQPMEQIVDSQSECNCTECVDSVDSLQDATTPSVKATVPEEATIPEIPPDTTAEIPTEILPEITSEIRNGAQKNETPPASRIFSVYLDLLGTLAASETGRERLEMWLEEYGEDAVMEALTAAFQNNVRKPAYVEGCLRNIRAGRQPPPRAVTQPSGEPSSGLRFFG